MAAAGLAAYRRSTIGTGAGLWAVAASLAIAAHAIALLPLLPQVLWLARKRRGETTRGTIMGLARALALPAVVAVTMWVRVVGQGTAQSWIPALSVQGLRQAALDTIGIGTAVVVAAIVLAFLLVEVRNEDPANDGAAAVGRVRAVDLVVLAGWAGGPLVVVVAISVVDAPLLVTRYLLPSAVACAVLTGIAASAAVDAVGRWRPRTMGSTLAGLVLLLGIAGGALLDVRGGALRPAPKPDDLRAAADWILAEQQPTDVLLYMPGWAEFGLRWYLVERQPVLPGPVDVVADLSTTAIDVGHHRTPATNPDAAVERLTRADRAWIAGYPDEALQPGDDLQFALAATVRSCWTLLEQRSFGLVVELWAAPPSGPRDCD